MYTRNKKIGSEPILLVLNNERFDDMDYLEPFVGMGHILRRVVNKKSYTASDLNPYAFNVLQALQRCKRFPSITKPVFSIFKSNTPITAMKFEPTEFLKQLVILLDSQDFQFEPEELEAFSALATFRSQPWSTYQGNTIDGESQDWKRQREEEYRLLLESHNFFETRLFLRDYRDYRTNINTNTVIYCDPPYFSSKKSNRRYYGNHVDNFDYEAFWEIIRLWSQPKLRNAVFVSEYEAPSDFIVVTRFGKKGALSKQNLEKLFMTKESYNLWFANS